MTSEKPYFLEEVTKTGDKTLLCVHGLNQNANALKPLLKDLGQLGMRVFLLHLPGHAINKRLASRESVSQSYKESYQYIYDQYGQVDSFVGYSFGGLNGTAHLDQYPF
ncbi:MAG: alpha/beta fold hydrolase, partial [Bdellovibrionales bacterium]|nr:alpha/beta hydrolase [Bdellovibrionales bacterium]NQZ19262.1 alpha/beta fold hydrolase [Bdellovibrionales bacterium]